MTKQQGRADSTASKVLGSLHGQWHLPYETHVSEKGWKEQSQSTDLLFVDAFSLSVFHLCWANLATFIKSFSLQIIGYIQSQHKTTQLS